MNLRSMRKITERLYIADTLIVVLVMYTQTIFEYSIYTLSLLEVRLLKHDAERIMSPSIGTKM